MSAKIPVVGLPKPATLPAVSERTLGNGLRVIAARRAGVPLVNVLLRVPNAGTPLTRVHGRMLEGSMLLGTARRDAVALAAQLQGLGSEIHVHADADRIILGGSVLASHLGEYLGVLDEVISSASYPAREVSGEKDRARSDLAYLRSRPGAKADEALNGRLYGSHPYGAALPSDSALEKVSAASLRSLHKARLVPSGAVLVLVGDRTPKQLLDSAEEALGAWTGSAVGAALPQAKLSKGSGLLLVDRPGSVQTTLLMGGPAAAPGSPDEAVLAVANMVFGGYFSSRLVANIRERNGFSYSPRSGIAQRPAASVLSVQADVATAVTSAALHEMYYELGRIASTPVSASELESAKAYIIGTGAIVMSTQGGVANTILRLAAWNLPWTHVTDHAKRVAAVEADEVLAAAAAYLAPTAMTTVAVGDASLVSGGLAAITSLA